jgi:hypothetical protein
MINREEPVIPARPHESQLPTDSTMPFTRLWRNAREVWGIVVFGHDEIDISVRRERSMKSHSGGWALIHHHTSEASLILRPQNQNRFAQRLLRIGLKGMFRFGQDLMSSDLRWKTGVRNVWGIALDETSSTMAP